LRPDVGGFAASVSSQLASRMKAGANAPTTDPQGDPRHGDPVAIDGRKAVFLYRRGGAAVVRFQESGDSRVVPFAKLRRAS
jgi:hypothetical protein